MKILDLKTGKKIYSFVELALVIALAMSFSPFAFAENELLSHTPEEAKERLTYYGITEGELVEARTRFKQKVEEAGESVAKALRFYAQTDRVPVDLPPAARESFLKLQTEFDSLVASHTKDRDYLGNSDQKDIKISIASEVTQTEPEPSDLPSRATGAEGEDKRDEDKRDEDKKDDKNKAKKPEAAAAEEEALKKARERAANKRAEERERLRDIERLQQQQETPTANSQGGKGGGKGGNQGGDQGGGNPQNSGNNNNFNPPNFSNDAIDKLANRLGAGNQGLANFSALQSSSKKDEEKKNNFSLEPSKNKNSFEDSLLNASDKNKKPNLPKVQNLAEEGIPFTGSPMSLMPPNTASNNPNLAPGAAPTGGAGMGGGAGNGAMGFPGGAMAMGGMMDSGGDFPFSVTGESYGDESEYDEWPRYRVMNVAMTGGSGESGSSFSSFPDYSTSSVINNKTPKKGEESSPFLYFLNTEEQALRDVPGIFRSLAAGYRKTRVQNLCSQWGSPNVGICKKMGKTSKNNLKKDAEG